MKATITFTPMPRVSYVISYKERTSSVWIIPVAGNPTTSSPFYINGLTVGVEYDFKIESSCGEIFTFQGEPTCPPVSALVAMNV